MLKDLVEGYFSDFEGGMLVCSNSEKGGVRLVQCIEYEISS